MIAATITPQEAVNFLNELIALDGRLVTALFMRRLICGQEWADHPTVQVRRVAEVQEPPNDFAVYEVGMLGILNGMFGVDEKGWGAIVAHLDDADQIVRFNITEVGLKTPMATVDEDVKYAPRGLAQHRQKLYEAATAFFEGSEQMESSTGRWMLVDHLLEALL